MDYYQFFSQLNNNSTQANNNNVPSNDLISLPNVNNNTNQNNNNNNSTVNNSKPSFQEDNSNFMMSSDYQDMIEKQKVYKELIEKQKENQQQKQQAVQPAVDSNLSSKLDNFMKAIERKLESLESSVSTLSQEFQSFSYHQSNYNNEFLRAISHLSNDISSTKNTIAQVSTVSTLSKSSSFSISPAFAEQLKGPSQEDIDAEIAKKLQDEFDRMAVSNNRPSPPPTPSNNIFPMSSSSNLYPVSAANNIYGNISPALPLVNNSLSGSISSNSPGERGECPFCNINLPLKDLQVHVESHLANNETPPPASNATNPSLWNKLFGGKSNTQAQSTQPKPPVNQPPKSVTAPQPVYRQLAYPPQGSMVYRQMPGQPMPMNGQPMPGQPMPMNGQPMPMNGQLMPGQPMPMNGQPFSFPQGQQIIYVNPDGSPIYPK